MLRVCRWWLGCMGTMVSLHRRSAPLVGQWMHIRGPLRAATSGPTKREAVLVRRMFTSSGPPVVRVQSTSIGENAVVKQKRVFPVVCCVHASCGLLLFLHGVNIWMLVWGGHLNSSVQCCNEEKDLGYGSRWTKLLIAWLIHKKVSSSGRINLSLIDFNPVTVVSF